MRARKHRAFSTACVTGIFAALLALTAAWPLCSRWQARRAQLQRVARITRSARHNAPAVSEPALSLRVTRLGPLLASWQSIGGCGAGSTGGVGTVKWIGHNTSGGLFQDITLANYIHLAQGYNLIFTTQLTRDFSDRWNFGVLVPFAYKRYNDYKGLDVDIANVGLADINLLGTYKFGEIRDTSLTLSVGVPTGTHEAKYRMDLLTQEKQLGPGRITGSVVVDHMLDKDWGLIVLGGMASWRGGENELGNYRAPFASLYGYAGYFLGPLVPSLGLALSGYLKPDRDRGIEQDVPTLLASLNASVEWSNDWLAVLLGVSVPIGLYAPLADERVGGVRQGQNPIGIQPWTAAIGFSVSPF
ncbi:MAG TPA: hypothetical protein VFN67_35675 [Polyangiales bacterium]|nr:hypothetical protein [Polyangiales bacterium]